MPAAELAMSHLVQELAVLHLFCAPLQLVNWQTHVRRDGDIHAVAAHLINSKFKESESKSICFTTSKTELKTIDVGMRGMRCGHALPLDQLHLCCFCRMVCLQRSSSSGSWSALMPAILFLTRGRMSGRCFTIAEYRYTNSPNTEELH